MRPQKLLFAVHSACRMLNSADVMCTSSLFNGRVTNFPPIRGGCFDTMRRASSLGEQIVARAVNCWRVACQSQLDIQPCAYSLPAATFYTIVGPIAPPSEHLLLGLQLRFIRESWPAHSDLRPSAPCRVLLLHLSMSIVPSAARAALSQAWPHMNRR